MKSIIPTKCEHLSLGKKLRKLLIRNNQTNKPHNEMYAMKKLLMGILISTTALQASTSSMSTETLPLAKNTTWLVHKTRIFPHNGIMIAGSLPQIASSNNGQVTVLNFLIDNGVELVKAIIPSMRNTLHWSVNSLVYPHKMDFTGIAKTKGSLSQDVRELYSYIIMEKLESFSQKKLCGYWQDAFHLGAHTLSKEALILVPAEDESYKQYIGSFQGKIVNYSRGHDRATVESLLKAHGAPILYPRMNRPADSPTGCVNENTRHQDIEIEGKPFTSKVISTCIGLDHTVHSSTDLGKFHEYALDITRPLRTTLLLTFIKSILMAKAGKDIHDTSIACSTCSVESKNSPTGSLLQCSACHTTSYCSKDCQREDWSSHKKICPDLLQQGKSVEKAHQEYLKACLRYATPGALSIVKSELDGEFKKVIAYFTDLREKKILQDYKEYLYLIIDYLYSTQEPYLSLRSSYTVNSLDGFITFCTFVRDTVRPLEKKFEGV